MSETSMQVMMCAMVLAGLALAGGADGADRWPGLKRATFERPELRDRAVALLDMFEQHERSFPGKPGLNELFLLIKGDAESVAQANARLASDKGEARDFFVILHHFRDLLTDDAVAGMDKWIRAHIREGSWQWTRTTQLYNINWPLQACEVLILGGEMMNDPKAANHGYAKLQEVLDGLTRLPIGTVSEFNSPTYYGVDIDPLQKIAQYTTNEEYRIKAMILEERLWLDLASRYSPTIRQLAGPYSRVYHDGLVGGTAIARTQMFKALNSGIYTQFDLAMQYPHYWDLTRTPSTAFQNFHCPEYIAAIAAGKTYPYRVLGTSAGDEFRGYPFAKLDLDTCIAEDWALGSNSRHWLDGGQNAACILYWRKRPEVTSMKDFKVAVSRYQVNDGGPNVASLEQPEMGRLHSLQDAGTVLVAYRPKTETTKVHSLRLDLQIPLYDDVDELSIGYRPVDPHAPDVATTADNRVYIRDGNVMIGIRPVAPDNLGAQRPLRVRRSNGFLLVSICNLDLPEAKEFAQADLLHCRNGFVLEVSDTSRWADLNAFRNHFEAGQLEDKLEGDSRSITYTNGGQVLSMAYNMATEEFEKRTVNGQPVAYPLFSCPHAIIGTEGTLSLGRTHLTTEPGTYAWLVADEKQRVYAAYNFTDKLVPVQLETPDGIVRAEKLGFGKIVFRPRGKPVIEVWAVKRDGPVVFPRSRGAKATLNGKDVTQKLERATVDGTDVLRLP